MADNDSLLFGKNLIGMLSLQELISLCFIGHIEQSVNGPSEYGALQLGELAFLPPSRILEQ